MKELSLNILDIAQNSVSAGAKNITVSLSEDEKGILTLAITDDGKGMSPEMVRTVTDPFCTTRTTRKVGMGIPLLKMASEQAGGSLSIVSVSREVDPVNCGTTVKATFDTTSIDFTPLGDVVDSMVVLIQGHPEIDYLFLHTTPNGEVRLDTKELRAVLGEDISLGEFEILAWIRDSLEEQYQALKNETYKNGGVNS